MRVESALNFCGILPPIGGERRDNEFVFLLLIAMQAVMMPVVLVENAGFTVRFAVTPLNQLTVFCTFTIILD